MNTDPTPASGAASETPRTAELTSRFALRDPRLIDEFVRFERELNAALARAERAEKERDEKQLKLCKVRDLGQIHYAMANDAEIQLTAASSRIAELEKARAAAVTPAMADEENGKLHERVKELEKDKARLDWLEKLDATIPRDEGCGDGPSIYFCEYNFGNINDRFMKHVSANSVRAAIDAAMSNNSSPNAGTSAPTAAPTDPCASELAEALEVPGLAETIAKSLYGYFEGGSAGSTDAMRYFENYKASGACRHVIERVQTELDAALTRYRQRSSPSDGGGK